MKHTRPIAVTGTLALAATLLTSAGVTPAIAVNCSTAYECLAIEALHGDDEVYVLTEDISGVGPITLGDQRSLTIDLNGHNLTSIGTPGSGSWNTTGALVVPETASLTITDTSPGEPGTLTATAADYSTYPGIGGRPYETAGEITILRGNVIATGSTVYNNDGGAGIGAGFRGSASTITIHGGNVTAFGGGPSAGIGGSSEGAAGSITITGGTVRAESTGAAGIGSGPNILSTEPGSVGGDSYSRWSCHCHRRYVEPRYWELVSHGIIRCD